MVVCSKMLIWVKDRNHEIQSNASVRSTWLTRTAAGSGLRLSGPTGTPSSVTSTGRSGTHTVGRMSGLLATYLSVVNYITSALTVRASIPNIWSR